LQNKSCSMKLLHHTSSSSQQHSDLILVHTYRYASKGDKRCGFKKAVMEQLQNTPTKLNREKNSEPTQPTHTAKKKSLRSLHSLRSPHSLRSKNINFLI